MAILFATVLVFGTVGVAMAGNLGVEDAGGNEDEIIFGSQTKEDGYIGVEMPEAIDENATETDYYIESVEQFNNFQAISKTNNFTGLTVHLAANPVKHILYTYISTKNKSFPQKKTAILYVRL